MHRHIHRLTYRAAALFGFCYCCCDGAVTAVTALVDFRKHSVNPYRTALLLFWGQIILHYFQVICPHNGSELIKCTRYSTTVVCS